VRFYRRIIINCPSIIKYVNLVYGKRLRRIATWPKVDDRETVLRENDAWAVGPRAIRRWYGSDSSVVRERLVGGYGSDWSVDTASDWR
jgi:hypothetical protein